MDDKLALTTALRAKVSETELPKEIRLGEHEVITDPKKFFDTHLSVIENSKANKEFIKPYSDRLKKALSLAGIDIAEVRSKLKNK